MAKKSLPLSKVYSLLESGPVVMVTTAWASKMNVMPMSWHTMMEFDPPLIDECYANFECRVVDTSMVKKYCFFVVEVVKAWIDPAVKEPLTIHHQGKEDFMVAGKTIKIKSKMK